MEKNLKLIILEVVWEALVECSVIALYGWVVQTLWNSVVVTKFSLPTLTYWDSLSLIVLFDVFNGFSQRLNKFRAK